MEIVNVKISDIVPYENNPRNNADAVDYVVNSIKEFGFKNPIIIDRNNVIVAGHTRLLAAKKIGLTSVPCIIADDLTEEQIKAFRLVDNKVAEFSVWNENLLDLELSEIADFDIDMSEFGFDLMDESESSKSESEKRYESLQLKAFEHYDYVVFVFRNQFDWLKVVSEFDIKKVDAGYGKTKKVGVGRIIDGKKLLEKMGYKDSDIEPWEE